MHLPMQTKKLDFFKGDQVLKLLALKTILSLVGQSRTEAKICDTYGLHFLQDEKAVLQTGDGRTVIDLNQISLLAGSQLPLGIAGSWRRHDGWKIRPLGTLVWEQTEYLCKNQAHKGILRTWLVRLTGVHIQEVLITQVLRGYEEEAKELLAFINSGIGAQSDPSLSQMVAGALGLDFVRPQRLRITPDSTLQQALGATLTSYVEAAFAMVAGVREDADSECLHEYRVQSRKVRSLVSIFKKSFDFDLVPIKTELASLMHPTNELRDLDVMLEAKQNLVGVVEEKLRPSLGSVFRSIQVYRDQVQDRIGSFFQSPGFVDAQGRIRRYLEPHSPLWTPLSRTKTVDKECARLLSRGFMETVAETTLLGSDAEPEAIHALRLQHKRLRYLLDFMSELAPNSQVTELRTMLKASQKYLGLYNDSTVQLAWLRNWLQEHGKTMDSLSQVSMERLLVELKNQSAEYQKKALDHAGASISSEAATLVKSIVDGGRAR